MVKKAVFSPAHPARAKTRAFPVDGRSERGTEAYFFRYVEVPSDARTKLEASFNILLDTGSGCKDFLPKLRFI